MGLMITKMLKCDWCGNETIIDKDSSIDKNHMRIDIQQYSNGEPSGIWSTRDICMTCFKKFIEFSNEIVNGRQDAK